MIRRKILSNSRSRNPILDFPPLIAYAYIMKRCFGAVLAALILGTAGTPVAFAQLGDAPDGYEPHVSEDVQMAFFYPSEWFIVEQDGNIAVVNRPGLADQVGVDQPDLQPGDTMFVLNILPTLLMTMIGIPAEDAATIVEAMFETMIAEQGNVVTGEAQTHSFGDRTVASLMFDDAGERVSGMLLAALNQEDVLVFSMALGFREDLMSERERVARTVATAEFTGELNNLLNRAAR
jgi:hypothetical protein